MQGFSPVSYAQQPDWWKALDIHVKLFPNRRRYVIFWTISHIYDLEQRHEISLRGCVKNAHLRSNRVKRSGSTGQRKLLCTQPLIPLCVQNGTIAARVTRRNGSPLNIHWYNISLCRSKCSMDQRGSLSDRGIARTVYSILIFHNSCERNNWSIDISMDRYAYTIIQFCTHELYL